MPFLQDKNGKIWGHVMPRPETEPQARFPYSGATEALIQRAVSGGGTPMAGKTIQAAITEALSSRAPWKSTENIQATPQAKSFLASGTGRPL